MPEENRSEMLLAEHAYNARLPNEGFPYTRATARLQISTNGLKYQESLMLTKKDETNCVVPVTDCSSSTVPVPALSSPKRNTTMEKLRKAPCAPKRFKSAFIFYSTWKHKEIKKELKQQGIKRKMVNIAKMVSESWKTLPKEARVVWEEKAREDRLRYEAEKAAYNGPWKIKASTFSVQKDPSAPKKPMSAYLSYANKQRAMVKGMHPSATNGEISKLLSSMWKGAPDSVRQIYINEEARLREIYHAEKAQWLEDKNRSIRNMRDPDENHVEEGDQETVNTVETNKPAVHSMCIEPAVPPEQQSNSCVVPHASQPSSGSGCAIPPASQLSFAPAVIDPQFQVWNFGPPLPSIEGDVPFKSDVDFEQVFNDLLQDEEPIPAAATSGMSSMDQGSVIIEKSDWGHCLPTSCHGLGSCNSPKLLDDDTSCTMDTITLDFFDNVATLLDNVVDSDDIFG